MPRIFCALVLAGLSLHVPAALAQGPVKLPAAKNGKLPNLFPVMAPSATCVALSEAQKWLAFGHRDQLFHVSLVRLDAKGIPAANAQTLTLPHPAGLAKFKNYPVALCFHPKLPLLYVWQDFNLQYDSPPTLHPPDVNLFDHLVIFDLAKEKAEPLVALCRGPEYRFNFTAGDILAEPTGSYLYVPNMRTAGKEGWHQVGRFDLDEAGLPKLDAADAKLPVPARMQKLTALNAAKPIVPQQRTHPEYITMFPHNAAGTGMGFFAPNKETVIMSNWQGMVSWRPEDKAVTQHALTTTHGGHKRLGVHPELPAMYVTIFGTKTLYRTEHADGYLTMLPEDYLFADTEIHSQPAVLSKSKKLAVGGPGRIYVVNLDPAGRLTGDVVQVPVLCQLAQAIVYAPTFDLLYVGVEISR